MYKKFWSLRGSKVFNSKKCNQTQKNYKRFRYPTKTTKLTATQSLQQQVIGNTRLSRYTLTWTRKWHINKTTAKKSD